MAVIKFSFIRKQFVLKQGIIQKNTTIIPFYKRIEEYREFQ